MSDWSIRLARRADAEAIPAIETNAGKLFAQIDGLGSLADAKPVPIKRQQRYARKGHCLVAEISDTVVGFMTTEPVRRELHIRELSVCPEQQRRGIGAALLHGCLIDARNSGFSAVTLTTFSDVAWNAPFYAKIGFQKVTALDAHPRLAQELTREDEEGLPMNRRCAMIRFLES